MVSIIIPVYNCEKYIKRCLDSILNQTYKDIEIILIDDGSSDNSLSIANNFAEKDNRVKVFHHENNGVSYTRNRGIKLAQGEYIQFVDCDDYIDANMTETLVNRIEEFDTDLVICGCVEVTDYGTENISCNFEGVCNIMDLEKNIPEIFSNALVNGPVNKLFKKEHITDMFPEDTSLGEDLIFNINYLKNINTVYFTKENFYMYEIHDGSLNRKYRENSIDIAERLYLIKMDFIKYAKLGTQAIKDASTTFILFLFYGLSDLYDVSKFDNKTKKIILKKWIYNRNVIEAVKHAEFKKIKYKISKILIRRKLCFLFDFMMKVKGCI